MISANTHVFISLLPRSSMIARSGGPRSAFTHQCSLLPFPVTVKEEPDQTVVLDVATTSYINDMGSYTVLYQLCPPSWSCHI